MKFFIALASILFIGTVSCKEKKCVDVASNVCSATNVEHFQGCNAQFGAIPHIESHLQTLANQHLTASYDYLLLGTFYNTYQRDRPGFAKLYRSLSDEAFENSIKMIKHVAKRGGVSTFRMHQQSPTERSFLNFDELQSLAKALDIQKELSKKAIEIHGHASVHNNHSLDYNTYDPEITHFLEEEYLKQHASTIRKLSGYANDLFKIVDRSANGVSSTALGVYLFDEYLQKQ